MTEKEREMLNYAVNGDGLAFALEMHTLNPSMITDTQLRGFVIALVKLHESFDDMLLATLLFIEQKLDEDAEQKVEE